MKSIVIKICITFIILLSGYKLLSPYLGFLLSYIRWANINNISAISGNVIRNGTTIHFLSYGKGPALLLLHGGLSNKLSWFSQIPELESEGRQIIILDVRGHGRSGIGTNKLSYSLLATDAIEVLDHLYIKQADIVGWSDGGNTALLMARDWPERIRKIITISANFTPRGLTPDELAKTHTQSSGAEYWFTRLWTGAGNKTKDLESRIKEMWRTKPMLQINDLHKITTPILVIIGKHDIIKTEHARKMAAALPNGTLKIIPGGHATPITQPAIINNAIKSFLNNT